MNKLFHNLKAILGTRRGLPLRSAFFRRALIFAAAAGAITALLSAQSPEQTASATPAPSPAVSAAPASATPAAIPSAPALPPDSPPPPLGDVAPSAPEPPAPLPTSEESVLLEAQPLSATNASVATDAPPSSPFASEAAPASSAPPAASALRAADVAFPTPSSRIENEPLVAIGRPVSRTDYGEEGNRKAAYWRSMPPERFTFDRASLRDVLRFLAEASGIPYIGIPEHAPQAQQLVTFRMTASPFAALESVARQNDIKLTYDDGVWFMRLRDANLERTLKAEDENELIGVVYQLRHDPADRIDFRPGTTAQTGAANSSQMIGAPSIPLQNSQRVFQSKSPKIINEIRVMLGMKPLQYAEDGTVTDPDVSGGIEVARLPIPPYAGSVSTNASSDAAASQQVRAGVPVYLPPQKPQVVYNSDTNILWVVATRRQHKWVASYLQRVDSPQDLIAIEVKFFETDKNPQTDFGINWEGTFGGDGLVVSGSATANPSGSYTTESSRNSTSDRQTEFGAVTVDSTGRTTVDSRSLTTSTPFSAVLSTSEASVAIQAFVKDRDSSLVQYPRVLTINNREVVITSAENTPVNGGVSTVQSGGTSSEPVGTLAWIPVGTQINIFPKTVGKNQIALTVAITVSQIVDYVQLDLGTGPNPYPVTTQRVYNAALQIDSGYTLAVGGLEKVYDRNTAGGIPLLKDIPGLGYLFKNKSRNRNRSNLIIFITPYTISDPSRTPGISETPETVVPLRPGVPPPAPNFAPDGSLLGGEPAIPAALQWLEFQLQYFSQTNEEHRDDTVTMRELRSVIQRARWLADHLQARVQEAGESASPETVENSRRADNLLLELNKVLAAAQLDQFQMREGLP